MLKVSRTSTYSDVIKLYQLLKELFGGENGLIIKGFDISQVDSVSIRLSAGKALTPTLDVIELTENTTYNIFDIQSERRDNVIPDGNHILVIGMTNRQTPVIQLIIEKAPGVFDNFPIDYTVIKIIEVSGGAIVNFHDTYLDYEVRKITMTSDQEIGGGTGVITEHNDLSGIQGGIPPAEFYHLSLEEYTTVQDLNLNKYKFLASVNDTTPGFLSDKIDNNLFEVSSLNLLTLKDNCITTDHLEVGLFGTEIELNAATLGEDLYVPFSGEVLSLDDNPNKLWNAQDILIRTLTIAIDIVDAPTGTETPNATYIVSSAPSGIFVGHENQIAVLIKSDPNVVTSWVFVQPKIGQEIYIQNIGKKYMWEGSVWVLSPANASGNTGEVQFNSYGKLASSSTFTFDSSSNTLSVTNVQANYISSAGNNGVTLTFDVLDAWDDTKFWHLTFENGILVEAVLSSK